MKIAIFNPEENTSEVSSQLFQFLELWCELGDNFLKSIFVHVAPRKQPRGPCKFGYTARQTAEAFRTFTATRMTHYIQESIQRNINPRMMTLEILTANQ